MSKEITITMKDYEWSHVVNVLRNNNTIMSCTKINKERDFIMTIISYKEIEESNVDRGLYDKELDTITLKNKDLL